MGCLYLGRVPARQLLWAWPVRGRCGCHRGEGETGGEEGAGAFGEGVWWL